MAFVTEFFSRISMSELALGLFFIGLFGAMTQRSIIKTIMSIGIMDAAAIVFPVSGTSVESMADPVPQALMITAIVIGVSVTAMCLAMYMRVVYRYGTADWNILIRRMEE